MVKTRDKGIVLNIVHHCKRIEEKVSVTTKEQFETDIDIKEIVCFNIFQIGELVKHLSIEFVNKYDKMPWKNIKGMRDWIGHGYGTIDIEQIWKTSVEEIKPLREYCEQIISEN